MPGLELQGETPRFGLISVIHGSGDIFGVVTLVKALLGGCSDLNFKVKTHDLTFGCWIWRWRHLCVVPFLEA